VGFRKTRTYIFVDTNRAVEEVPRSSSEDEVDIAFNVGLEGKHRARYIECVLVAVDLAAVHVCKLGALDCEPKGCDVLLSTVVVSKGAFS
jgi:hypothetical protein